MNPRKPLIMEMEETADPSTAPPVPEPDLPEARAMQGAAAFAARRPSWLGRLFWGLLGAILSFAISVAAWTFVADLMARYPLLGWLAAVLIGAFRTGRGDHRAARAGRPARASSGSTRSTEKPRRRSWRPI